MQTREVRGALVAEVAEEEFQNPWLLEDAFESMIEGMKDRTLVVDLRDVESITSLGIAVLVAIQGLAIIHRSRVLLAGVRSGVRRWLELVGADQILEIYETVEEGLKSLDRRADAPPGSVAGT